MQFQILGDIFWAVSIMIMYKFQLKMRKEIETTMREEGKMMFMVGAVNATMRKLEVGDGSGWGRQLNDDEG